MLSNADLGFVEPTGVFSTSGTNTEPIAAKRITGTIKDEGLPAAWVNYYWNMLTVNGIDSITAFTNIIDELNNLLAYFSVTPSAASDTQIRDAIVAAFITGVFSNTNTTTASSGVGAIKTAGGIYTTKNIYAETTISGSSITSRGDAIIGGDLEVTSDILASGVTSLLGRIADSNGAITGLLPTIGEVECAPYSITSCSYVSLAAVSRNRVVVAKVGTTELLTCDFDGSAWAIYSSKSTSALSRPSITALNPTMVAYIDHTSPTIRLYNPEAWSAVSGGVLAITNASYPVITAINEDTLVLLDAYHKELREYRWTGSEILLTSSTSVASKITGGNIAMTTLGNEVVVFLDCSSGWMQTYYKVPTGGFTRLSSYRPYTSFGNTKLVALSNNHIAIIDDTNDVITIHGITSQVKASTDILTWKLLDTISRSTLQPGLTCAGSGRLVFLDADGSLYSNKIVWQPPTAYELF